MTFRVVQFNMQYGQVWSDTDPDHAPIDLEETIAELLSHHADLILLQEVERALPGGRQAHPPPNYTRLLAALPGWHGHFAYPRPDPRELPFGIGLAILSRAPLHQVFAEELPSPPVPFTFAGEPRTPTDRLLIGARTTLGGRELQVLNTHLLAFFMLNTTSEQHPEQRSRVATRLKQASGPTLLGGDFNVSRHTSLIAQFAEAGFRTAQDREITWRRRPYVLDHLFFNPGLRLHHCRVVPTPASDHHVLVADFSHAV